MTVRTITVTLPEDIYMKLEAQAHTTARSVDDLVAQGLTGVLPLVPPAELQGYT